MSDWPFDVDTDGAALTYDDGEGILHASRGGTPACGAWLNNGLDGPWPGVVSCLFCLTGDDYYFAIGDDGRDAEDYACDHDDDDVDHEYINEAMNDMRTKIGP